jgi:protein TonB
MERATSPHRLFSALVVAVALVSCSTAGERRAEGADDSLARTTAEDAPPRPRIFRHDEVERLPRLVAPLEPVYPSRERRLGLAGEVECRLVVSADGRPGSVEMLESSGASFERAVVEALRKARFEPGVRRGMPVPVHLTLRVEFVLD